MEMQTGGPYDDIIHLPHHTSRKHPRMLMHNRAAQFSPFAAVTGHDAACLETARYVSQRIELGEDQKNELDYKQQLLLEFAHTHPEVTITYFVPDKRKDGGEYITLTGKLNQVDSRKRVLVLENKIHIPADNVIELDSSLFSFLQ